MVTVAIYLTEKPTMTATSQEPAAHVVAQALNDSELTCSDQDGLLDFVIKFFSQDSPDG